MAEQVVANHFGDVAVLSLLTDDVLTGLQIGPALFQFRPRSEPDLLFHGSSPVTRNSSGGLQWESTSLDDWLRLLTPGFRCQPYAGDLDLFWTTGSTPATLNSINLVATIPAQNPTENRIEDEDGFRIDLGGAYALLPAATILELQLSRPEGGVQGTLSATPPPAQAITMFSHLAWPSADPADNKRTRKLQPTDRPLLKLVHSTADDPTIALATFDPSGNDRTTYMEAPSGRTPVARARPKQTLPALRMTSPEQSLAVQIKATGPTFETTIKTPGLSWSRPAGLAGSNPILRLAAILDHHHLVLQHDDRTDDGTGSAADITEGIPLVGPVGDSSNPLTFDYRGLDWRITPAKIGGPDGSGTRGHYFTLNVEADDYRLVLADGANAVAGYNGLGPDPIEFEVSNFAVTPAGVDARAEVRDTPARLNGFDAPYRFADTTLEIVAGELAGFTLFGTGPLPARHVGDANADIAIQFAPEGDAGAAAPVGAAANLAQSGMLRSPDLLVDYDAEQIGFHFVEDGGKYHFWYTLTAAAEFAPGERFPVANVLAPLAEVEIGLIDAPLADDATVLARHISFSVELADPATFSFAGCFEMAIEAVGFHPTYDGFDGLPGLELAGQLNFADGGGDKRKSVESRHRLVIGPPAEGDIWPQIQFKELSVTIQNGDAFLLDVAIRFVDDATMTGFTGEGTLVIKGMPTLAVAVGFMRVRAEQGPQWRRAWFIAVNVGKITLRIPYLQIYLREVGLGFGYRYTLVSLADGDAAEDIGKQLARLTELSRSQGDLATVDAWAIEVEDRGEDPRWTIAMRALFSQSASLMSTPLRYHEASEKNAPSIALFDLLVAVRSDLTFFAAARLWFLTNYNDYLEDPDLSANPTASGFAVFWPSRRRFLTQVATNPEGHIGSRPPLPDFLEDALREVQVSATALIEPGLFHVELGWPNQLRWKRRIGPLVADFRGGAIFRIDDRSGSAEVVVGISFLARASISYRQSVGFGIAGITLSAGADAAFGARFMAIAKESPSSLTAHGAVNLDLRIRLSVRAWLRLDFGLFEVKFSFNFSLDILFSAGFELGLIAAGSTRMGLTGHGTISVKLMGRRFAVRARLEHNRGVVESARAATTHIANLSLSQAVSPAPSQSTERAVAAQRSIGGGSQITDRADNGSATGEPAGPPGDGTAEGVEQDPKSQPPRPTDLTLTVPDYAAVRVTGPAGTFVLVYPSGQGGQANGFLPVPPPAGSDLVDFEVTVAGAGVRHWKPAIDDTGSDAGSDTGDDAGRATIEPWESLEAGTPSRWRAAWAAKAAAAIDPATGLESEEHAAKLRDYLAAAFLPDGDLSPQEEDRKVADADRNLFDPPPIEPQGNALSDPQVRHPTEAAYEEAVRGAVGQFRSSPLFKADPDSSYHRALRNAFSTTTTVFGPAGSVDEDGASPAWVVEAEAAHQFRGMIVQNMIDDVRAAAAGTLTEAGYNSRVAFQLGLVFKLQPESSDDGQAADGEEPPSIDLRVRQARSGSLADARPVPLFNPPETRFDARPPQFEEFRQFADATTIAFDWDLEWPESPGLGDDRDDPEHHLDYYDVERRELGNDAAASQIQVKPAEVLNRVTTGAAAEDRIERLRPRFQLVDHFEVTAEEIASLGIDGRTYIYTITPVDVAGSRGRSITATATRHPNEPPPVPTDAQLTVAFVNQGSASEPDTDPLEAITAAKAVATWSEPRKTGGLPTVPIGRTELIFRREPTVPVGSYGLDSATRGQADRHLPSRSGRRLPTDVAVDVTEISADTAKLSDAISAAIRPEIWRPEAWQVFVQTTSIVGVPSPLVPVRTLLQFELDDVAHERQPAELEWPIRPLEPAFLPPNDARATVAKAHVVMPPATALDVSNAFTLRPDGLQLSFGAHPSDHQLVRLRWNQGSSAADAPPVALTAGYHIWRLDIDAHPATVFSSDLAMAAALVHVDEVRMQPDDDRKLVPNTTLTTSEWEAFYPSHWLKNRRSWDSHHLVFPTADSPGGPLLHSALRTIIADATAADAAQGAAVADVQTGRPALPGDLDALMAATPPSADPYGWGILAFLGLSATVTLRDAATGEVLDGKDTLQRLGRAIGRVAAADSAVDGVRQHIFVDALFQPGAATGAGPGPADPDRLLAMVQLSLRPIPASGGDEPTVAEQLGPLRAHLAAASSTDAVLSLPSSDELVLSVTDDADPPTVIQVINPAHRELVDRLKIWLERFVVAGPGADTGSGPWMATAQPQTSAPVITTPDDSGRVHYDDTIHDGWAHTYRYYIQPYSRYDRLWHGLGVVADDAAPPLDHRGGGIDVVVPRVNRPETPLVLHSRRLDEPGGNEPGPVWEVALAQHPEQALIEQNQRVERRLAYRRVAHSIVRRFAYGVPGRDLIAALGLDSVADIDWVAHKRPTMPTTLPDRLDHVPGDDQLLGAAGRIGVFGQAALVVQYHSLPFFYEHKLLAVAQSVTTASEVGETTPQRDFGYRSPAATGRVDVIASPDGEGYDRTVTLPLARLWDALTPTSQRLWNPEAPEGWPETSALRPAELPDPDVVYDIVLHKKGRSVEPVASVSLILDDEQDGVAIDADARGRDWAVQPMQTELTMTAGGPRRLDVSFVLTHTAPAEADSAGTGSEGPRPTVPAVSVAVTEPFAGAIEAIGNGPLTGDSPTRRTVDSLQLAWHGPLTDEQRQDLRRLDGIAPFRAARDRLIELATGREQATNHPSSPAETSCDLTVPIPELSDKVLAVLNEDDEIVAVTWIGAYGDLERERLDLLGPDLTWRVPKGTALASAVGAARQDDWPGRLTLGLEELQAAVGSVDLTGEERLTQALAAGVGADELELVDAVAGLDLLPTAPGAVGRALIEIQVFITGGSQAVVDARLREVEAMVLATLGRDRVAVRGDAVVMPEANAATEPTVQLDFGYRLEMWGLGAERSGPDLPFADLPHFVAVDGAETGRDAQVLWAVRDALGRSVTIEVGSRDYPLPTQESDGADDPPEPLTQRWLRTAPIDSESSPVWARDQLEPAARGFVRRSPQERPDGSIALEWDITDGTGFAEAVRLERVSGRWWREIQTGLTTIEGRFDLARITAESETQRRAELAGANWQPSIGELLHDRPEDHPDGPNTALFPVNDSEGHLAIFGVLGIESIEETAVAASLESLRSLVADGAAPTTEVVADFGQVVVDPSAAPTKHADFMYRARLTIPHFDRVHDPVEALPERLVGRFLLSGDAEAGDQTMSWVGPTHTDDIEALRLWAKGGDPGFQAAVGRVISDATAQIGEAVPLTLPVVAGPVSIGPELSDRLIIGHDRLEATNLLGGPTYLRMRDALVGAGLADRADEKALVLLYAESRDLDLNGGSLEIRSRRGSAGPSAATPLAKPLPGQTADTGDDNG